MSDQPTLFDPPILVDPARHSFSAPYAKGSETSKAGAKKVEKDWTRRQGLVLTALAHGPKSRQELEVVTPLKINAICSVVGALLKAGRIEVSPDDYEVYAWSDGSVTKRERVKLRR